MLSINTVQLIHASYKKYPDIGSTYQACFLRQTPVCLHSERPITFVANKIHDVTRLQNAIKNRDKAALLAI